jgi:hypothetical protein
MGTRPTIKISGCEAAPHWWSKKSHRSWIAINLPLGMSEKGQPRLSASLVEAKLA